MRARLLLVALLCVAFSCTRSATPNPSEEPVSPSPSNPPRATDPHFEMVGTPPPPGEHCPAASRQAGAYGVLIAPTAGKPGSRVTMGGYTPLFNEAGRYLGPSGKIGFWFNLPAEWEEVYSSLPPPTSNNGLPVIRLGEADVAGQCSYRVTFDVPDVPPGVYDIVPIQHGQGSSSAFLPLEFRVTA